LFRDARLKIQRANKHISDIQSIVLSLPDRYVSSVETDPRTRGQSIKHECPGIDETLVELSLIAGDAIHNLRASLDYAWVEIFQHLRLPVTKYTRFPFRDTAEALEGALFERKLNTIASEFFNCMVTTIKPYPGGDDLLCALHELDITDKHLLRIKVSPDSSIEGFVVQNEHGTLIEGGTWGSNEVGPKHVDFEPKIHVKDNGKISVSVVFDDTSILSGSQISDELTTFSMLIMSYLRLIENSLI